jgi:glucose/arabinose dehydrogenase
VKRLRCERMRRPVLGVSASLVLLALALPAAAGAVERRLVGNFNAPIQVAAPDWVPGSTIYVAEKGGRVVRRVAGGDRNVVLNITGSVSLGNEQGLLSIAFGPNRYMFVYYTNREGDSRVARYRLGPQGGHVQPGSRKLLMKQNQPFSNHNGGTLHYRDGHLYLSLGDGGDGCDPGERAQDLGTKLGKLLRRGAGGWTIVASGLRNPWRWSFDRMTGALYIGDVGQQSREEINFLPASKVPLPAENFGWDVYEGTEQNTCENTGLEGGGELIFPRFQYGHSGGGLTGRTVIGGFVYRGSNLPGQRGRYFFGDLDGWVRTADARTLDARRDPGFTVPTLVSFGENSQGELFAVSLQGPIYKLVPS